LVDFEINGLGVGEPGDGGRVSFLAAKAGETLKIRCKVAGLLEEAQSSDKISKRSLDKKPYWSIERARVKGTRQVPVELIVNGQSVDKKLIEADGRLEDVEFEYTPRRSSWIALRIFPAAHTNPIFVELDGKPVRASKRSAQWCLDAVERCWESKEPKIRDTEKTAARAAYDHAKDAYRKILDEAYDDTKNRSQRPARDWQAKLRNEGELFCPWVGLLVGRPEVGCADVRVDLCRYQTFMAEEFLDAADIRAAVQ